MKNAFLAVATAALLASLASTARADDWDKIGSRVVAFGGDHDTIDGSGDGKFTAIKIDVDDGNIEMYDIKVIFGNGDPFSPSTRLEFNENTRSRTIDLPGEIRTIRKIEFWYRSKFKKGRATVTVYGKRAAGGGGGASADEPRPPRGPAADNDKGWELLGLRVVDYGGDHDAIEVTASEGRFKQIKLDVERGNVDMFDIKVTFGDGESFSPGTRFEFREGSMSRTIDLPGDARVIRKVEFWYKSERRDDKARVRLYGNQAGGGGNDSKEKWEKLGSRIVDFVADKDTIEVGANEGRFDKIRIDVEEGNLDMWNVRVVFGDGNDFSPDTRIEFRQGSMSRTIDLPGEARVIRKIEFWYKSEFKKGRATVHVFGRQAAGGNAGGNDRPPQKDPKDRFPGWDFLGARVVDFGGDHDAIDCRGEGRFTSFQIEVENGDLEMYDIVVTFGNGEKESPRTRFTFDDNTRTRVIDLPGNKRFIKRVDFYYKSVRATRDGKATINLYGKR